MKTTTVAKIKSELNKAFPKKFAKYDHEGKKVCHKDYNGKRISLIPTEVVHSPMDATSVKQQKVNRIKQDVINFLVQQGGKLEYDTVRFKTKSGKEFGVIVTEVRLHTDTHYTEYYSSWIHACFI